MCLCPALLPVISVESIACVAPTSAKPWWVSMTSVHLSAGLAGLETPDARFVHDESGEIFPVCLYSG